MEVYVDHDGVYFLLQLHIQTIGGSVVVCLAAISSGKDRLRDARVNGATHDAEGVDGAIEEYTSYLLQGDVRRKLGECDLASTCSY
jgi:hypothetical protein